MAEQRLPLVNQDDGTWGDILRQYLMKEHYNGDTDLTQATSENGGHQKITIRPGTAAAGTAPLKFTSGTLLTTPEAGAVEFNTDRLYFTQTTGATRKTIATYDDSTGATGDLYYRNSSGFFTRLPIGSANNILTVSGGIPTWSASLSGATLDNTSTVTLKDTSFTLQDDGDTTKQLQFNLSAIGTGTTRTIAVPNVNGTMYVSSGTDVSVADGGTGRSTGGTAYGIIAAGTTATGAQQTIAPGTAGQFLKSAGTTALASFADIQLSDLSDSSSVVTLTGAQTLTNKTIDAASNTITNIDVADFAASAIVTEAEGIGSNDNDTTLPTSAAVKDYADTAAADRQARFMTGTVATAAATAAKTVTLDAPWASAVPATGDFFLITFTNGTSVSTPTLAVNGTAAKGIRTIQGQTSSTYIATEANAAILMFYDGTYYRPVASPTNAAYSTISDAEIINTASTSARLMTGQRAETLMANEADVTRTLTNKTINAASNTITNLDVADFAASAIVTASEGVSSNNNDTTLPTSAAVKSYVDGLSGWVPALKGNLQNSVPVYVTLSGFNFSNSSGQQIHITTHIGSGTGGARVYLEHKQGGIGTVAAFGSTINNLVSGGASELAWWADAATSTIYLRLTMSTTGNDWRNVLIEVANAPTISSSTSTTEPVGAAWTALSATNVLVDRGTAQTLTNKTIDAPALSGTITGTYTLGGTPTFPSTVVTTTGTQTLTNKTLTTPTIASFTNATHSHTDAAGGGQLNATTALNATGTASSSTYLRGDNTWATLPVTGDASTNTATSVDGEVAVFSGTGGKTIKRATGSGIATLTAGVLGTVTAPTGAIVGTTDTQTLTNKTISGSSNTLSNIALSSLAAAAYSSASTASVLAQRDANKNLFADNFIATSTSTATAGATTTLTVASTQIQVFTGTLTQTVTLPTTSVISGTQFRIVNNSTGAITVNASGGTQVVILAGNTSALLTALINTPTTNAHWDAQYWGSNVTSAKKFSVTQSLTFSGTDNTTMTFPAANDTIVGRASTDTLTNKTINAANNTITNLDVADFAASAIVTEAEGISANDNDTTLPTSAAVKDYADTQLANKVDKTATANRVYATDGSGVSTSVAYSSSATAATVMYRTTGGVTSVGTPTADTHATTKLYVDTGLAAKADTSHTHTAAQISDSTAIGRTVLTAADAAAVRTAIGAGTGNGDGDVTLAGTQTLTNKTLSTGTVINTLPTGTAVASASTASTLVTRDANKNVFADNFIATATTTATAGTTTALTVASTQIQVFTGTLTQTVTLPTTSVLSGTQFRIVNNSTGAITVNASGGTQVIILAGNTSALITAIANTPTTNAHWDAQYWGSNITSAKKFSVTQSITLSGTDNTTMTFPAANDTIVGRASTDTLTNKTLTAPVLSGTITGTYTLGGTPTFPSTVVMTTGAQTLASKTLTTPTIGDFTNATHDHVDAAGGGQLNATTALNATGTKSSATFLRGDNTWATPPNTTYSEIPSTEITAGTATTGRLISGRRAQEIVDKAVAASGDVTLAGTQTLTNKTISGSSNTFSNIPTSALGTGAVTGSNNGTATSLTLWKGTQAQYNALGTYNSNTIYVVTNT